MKNRFFRYNGGLLLQDIVNITGAELILGSKHSAEMLVKDICHIEECNDECITYLHNAKYTSEFLKMQKGICLLDRKFDYMSHASFANTNSSSGGIADAITVLLVDDPYYAYSCIASKFYEEKISNCFDKDCAVSRDAKIGNNVRIGHGVVIEDNVEIADDVTIEHGAIVKTGVMIGAGSRIGANSVISHAIIGERVYIYPGCIIGSDGFGFATYKGKHYKILHTGCVVIGNDVEIGAGSTIDRGSVKNTYIGNNVMIDNLVQIGHNVTLGDGCVIVSQVGIAGSTTCGKYVSVGGQAGIAGHLQIDDMASIAAKSGVIGNVDKGEVVGGYPAVPIRTWHKQNAVLKRIATYKADRMLFASNDNPEI
jgi:UDP-3-O-[3-hydroxymyristoyl] glucosamine N-acyltransferase